jgi:hypothetical protein
MKKVFSFIMVGLAFTVLQVSISQAQITAPGGDSEVERADMTQGGVAGEDAGAPNMHGAPPTNVYDPTDEDYVENSCSRWSQQSYQGDLPMQSWCENDWLGHSEAGEYHTCVVANPDNFGASCTAQAEALCGNQGGC